MSLLAGKTALISGAAKGLGIATAAIFVREGSHVVLGDIQQDLVQEKARELGSAATGVRLDVTSAESWQEVISEVCRTRGHLDVLVNNAGVQGIFPIEQTTPDVYDSIVAVNQRGSYLGCRAALPDMMARGSGVIVNVSSTNGVGGMAATSAYTSAKHAVIGLTRALALEVAPRGVRVVAVGPGSMRTPMLTEAFGDQAEEFARQVPLGRLAEPSEVGELIAFLASNRASYCTGGVYMADGGLTA